MSAAFTATMVLGADIDIEARCQRGSDAESVIGSVNFREGFAAPLSIITTDPAHLDRLAAAATKAAQLMRDRAAATQTPAPAASTPVSQATDAGAAEPAAAPASVRTSASDPAATS